MAAEADDAELLAEIERDAEALLATFELERTALLFSGEYDDGGAIISISAGAGGTEATDWAEMLLRMYLRWAERHRFRTEIVDATEGEQTGLKSVTVEINGRRRLRLAARRARASTAWSGSAPTTPRSGARRRSRSWRSCPRSTTTS